PQAERRSPLAVFVHQLKSPLIALLAAAAVLSFALGKNTDGVVIAVVVVLNTVIGALQEGRAERSLRALRRLTAQQAHVLRGGVAQSVDARELVPGDILLVTAGDAVAADARLVDETALQASEASITGE